jgi:hypothetical protein
MLDLVREGVRDVRSGDGIERGAGHRTWIMVVGDGFDNPVREPHRDGRYPPVAA